MILLEVYWNVQKTRLSSICAHSIHRGLSQLHTVHRRRFIIQLGDVPDMDAAYARLYLATDTEWDHIWVDLAGSLQPVRCCTYRVALQPIR
jgi:hypothetical protein